MTDAHLDSIYDFVDIYLKLGQFEFLNSIISLVWTRIQQQNIDLDEVITWLTVTLPAKDKLDERDTLFVIAKQWFEGENSENEHLFSGLD